MRFTPRGKAVTNFTMATGEMRPDGDGGKQERVERHPSPPVPAEHSGSKDGPAPKSEDIPPNKP